MTTELLATIKAAPRGRRTAAFFDFDGTMIDGYSAMAMMQHRWRKREMSPLEIARLLMVGVEAGLGRADFERFMRVGVKAFRGRQVDDMAEFGEKLMRSVLGGALYPEAWELVAAHRAKGHTVVVATSALPFQVEPLAREFGVDHVLCTRLEERDGILTGEVDGPILWGPGKAGAVKEFARANRIDLEKSFAYGNGSEDLQFLETVGRPTALNPTKELAAARRRARLAQRPLPRRAAAPGLQEVVRTVAAYGGLTAGLYAGLGVGLLKRSRKAGANTTMSVGSDVGLALGGIKLDVTGAEHLTSSRPAVFIFNHQSWLDGMIVMKLLRENVTAVAKQEVSSQPVMGQIGWLLNMAYVDRGNTEQAKAALAPVVERINEGYSLAISPEGTRSPTPRVGHFKKGAFHMALQAGVPIVPIVIRNAGQLLWRGSTVMRKGTVDIHVLPPVDTGDWTVENLGDARRGRAPAVRRHAGRVARAVTRPIQVTVLGGGSWGTTVASLAARHAQTVLWARSEETARGDPRRAPQLALPAGARPAPRARRDGLARGRRRQSGRARRRRPVARPARDAAARPPSTCARGSRSSASPRASSRARGCGRPRSSPRSCPAIPPACCRARTSRARCSPGTRPRR